MAPPKPEDIVTLRATIESSKALIIKFEDLIRQGSAGLPSISLNASSPNALALHSDAAHILRAQTTKLSLLALNKPFTPPEITFILKSLCQECIPAMASACQLCPSHQYTDFLTKVVRSSVSSTFRQYLNFLDELPLDEKGFQRSTMAQEILKNTGIIWQSMDFSTKLGAAGLIAIACPKIENWHSLLTDAIDELEEWQMEEMDNTPIQHKSPEELQFSNMCLEDKHWSRDSSNGLTMLEGPPVAATHAIQPLAKKAVKTLKLIALLYPALIKRRVKRFPDISSSTPQGSFPTPEQTSNFDIIMQYCEGFSSQADEIAGALYENDTEEVNRRLAEVKNSARDCLRRVRHRWDGGEDEFSTWVGKWLIKLDEL
ncbi:hypothetical protein MMC19_006821 [Ptychographa xylographoides]|nr:hypothetical protein [Ptychographa xylographoides]